jgi:type II secretory pathway pseudopilin PulG
MNYIQQTTRGFTVVETLMALTVFSMVVVALVTVSSSSVTNVNFMRNRLTASYLGQEGIEVVRNIRDGYLASGAGWNSFVAAFDNQCMSESGCDFDPMQSIAQGDGMYSVSSQSECTLQTDDNSGYYSPVGGLAFQRRTPYCRRIQFIPLADVSQNGLKIVSTVTWQDGTTPKTLQMVDYIYEWQ